MDTTKYIFRENGNVLSEQTYNGVGTSNYQNYGITAPTPSTQQGFRSEWDLDNINSGGRYVLDDNGTRYESVYYFDAIYIYDNSNYVTCNFLFADNGEFVNVTARNGNVTGDFGGFAAYYKNSIVSVTVHPRPGYSITDELTPAYQGTWRENIVYRVGTTEGCRITWKNYDGSTIRTTYVKEGETPTPPTVNRKGYTLTGWSPQIVPVVGDATYTAQYTINYYDIRFFSDPGVLFDQARLAYGTNLTEGTNPTKTDYTFVRWDPTLSSVKQDQDYYAVWEKTTFTINYYDDETLLNTVKVNKGNALPSYIPTKSGYRFDKWTPNIQSPVYADANYTATWLPTYTVTFYDSDGTSIISTNEYIIGEDIVIPKPPIKSHYIFIEWTPEVVKKCNGAATYTAVYSEYSTIIVNFYNYYGRVYSSEDLNIPGSDFVFKDFTLTELEAMGITIPILSDIEYQSFLKWEKHKTTYDENEKTIIFNFWPKFIDSKIIYGYCDNQLDDLSDDIDNHKNNINLHIVESKDEIKDTGKIVNSLSNIDDNIIDEIELVKQKNILNKQKILLLNNNGGDFETQLSYVYDDINDIQDEISEMNIIHKIDLNNISKRINNNETKITQTQAKIYSIPKHYIISQNEYKNLKEKDENAIYFTKEID